MVGNQQTHIGGAMKKKEVQYFYNEYGEICKKLCCDYKVTLNNLKLKYAYLIISKDSAIESIIYDELKILFVEYENSIIHIIEKIGNEFEKALDEKFLEEFKKENEKNINGYFEDIERIIRVEIRKETQESTKIKLNNLKENLKSNIIVNITKKNESIKRTLKKQRKKDSLGQKIINSVIDNFIGYIIAFAIGCITSNWKEFFEGITTIIS